MTKRFDAGQDSVQPSMRMKARTFNTVGVSMAVLGAAMIGMPALAQDADDAESTARRLGTVTVTARKVEENLQEVPVAVTAFTGAELAEKGVVQVNDLAAFTPGLTIREASSNPTAPNFSMRGQIQNDVLATLDPSVGTYVDGHYWARAYGLNIDLLDVEGVQVLKGPQGTLFGRNTTGGAILVTTADPNFDGISGTLEASLGNLSAQTYKGILNMPVIDDVLAVRGAIQMSSRDGYINDLVTGEDYNDRDISNARAKVLYTPTDTVRIVLSGEWFDQKMNGPGGGTIYAGGLTGAFLAGFNPLAAPGTPFPVVIPDYVNVVNGSDADDVALDANPFLRASSQTYNGTLTWDVGSGQFKLIAGQRKVKSNSMLDLDGNSLGGTDVTSLHATGGGVSLEQSSIEGQYAGTLLEDRFHYVVGATYFEESGYDKTNTRSLLFAVPGAGPFELNYRGDIDNTSVGVYAQGTYDLSDKLAVTAGVRYSEDEKGVTTNNSRSFVPSGIVFQCLGGQTPPNCQETYSDTFDDVSYTLGVDYKLTDNMLVYTKYSRGYRSGGQNLRLNGTGDLDFDPEIVKEIEAGFKGDLLDNRLRLNVAAFTNQIDDAQRSIIVAIGNANATVVQNAAKVKNTGAEVELTAILNDYFSIQAGASIIDSEYDEYLDAGVDVSDRHFIAIPESEFNIAAIYSAPVELGQLTGRLDYAWRDEYFNNEAPGGSAALQDAITSPASGALNARVGVDFGNGFELSVWGRNVLDNRDNRTSLYISNFGYVSGQSREPATYGITGTYRFGAK
tara:strand:- start:7 stop:2370 length:2364 start_codon:yes stop_codon:yes gene_type:complete